MNFKSCKVKNVLSGRRANSNTKRIKRRIGAVWNGFYHPCSGKNEPSLREKKHHYHWSKQIWWTITILTALVLCAFCIKSIYLKLTVITFDDDSTQISKIKFPTVTICNPIKVVPLILHYSYINKMIVSSNYTFNLTKNVIQQMYALSSFCSKDVILEYIKRNNITIDRNIWPYLQVLSPMWEYSYCSLLPYQQFDCRAAYAKSLNNNGICYSFNHLSSKEIYSEKIADDFPKFEQFFINETNTKYPYVVQKATQGFSEILIYFHTTYRHINPKCNYGPFDKNHLFLYIHRAEDQWTKEIPIPLDHMVHVSVRPNQISTDKKLINKFSIDERKCIATKEKNLEFYRNYSQTNCYYEKLIMHIISGCECAYFWMPRWNHTRLCSASDIKCYNEKKASFADIDLSTECLPACNSLTYDAKVTEIKLSKADNMDGYRLIKIAVGFDEQQYLFMKRTEIYGTIDFYVGCASIISLFMGASFLSICDKLYNVTLHPFLNRNRRRTRMKNTLTIVITLKPKLSTEIMPTTNGTATNKY